MQQSIAKEFNAVVEMQSVKPIIDKEFICKAGDKIKFIFTIKKNGEDIDLTNCKIDFITAITLKDKTTKIIEQKYDSENIKIDATQSIVMIYPKAEFTLNEATTLSEVIVYNENGTIISCGIMFTVSNSINGDVIRNINDDIIALPMLEIIIKDYLNKIESLNAEINNNNELTKRNEISRVESENIRNNSESVRVSSENIRITNDEVRENNEDDRKSSEITRRTNEQTRIDNENKRKLSENNRVDSETIRNKNENIRNENENIRTSSEDIRNSEEVKREDNETIRVTSENERSNSEGIRKINEDSRIKAEDSRIESESIRVSQENIREANELARIEAEDNRATAEINRANKENERVIAENTRDGNEATRIKNENDRKITETTRSENETKRVAAEEARVAEFNEIKSENETFKRDINSSFNSFTQQQEQNFNTLKETTVGDLEKSKTGYDGGVHKSLEDRLNVDFDNIHQKVNDSSYLPYEGTSIKADNSYYGLTKDLSVKGKTLQNLYPMAALSSTTIDENGYLTSTSATWDYLYRINQLPQILLKPNTEYTFVFDIIENTLNVQLRLRGGVKTSLFENESVVIGANTTGIKIVKVKTVTTFTPDMIYSLWLAAGDPETTTGGFKLRILMLEGDHTNTPLSELPFGEGIYSVGESEVTSDGKYPVKAKSTGKNLISERLEGFNLTGATELTFSKDSTCISYLAKVNKPGTYITSSKGGNRKRVGFFNEYPTVGTKADLFEMTSGRITVDGSGYIVYYTDINNVPSACDVQVEEGTVATPYEPYQESSIEYLLDEPLRSLPNEVRDTIEQRKDGVYHIQRIDKVTLDGSEVWNSFSTTSTDYNESILPVSTTAIKNNFNTTNSICSNVPQVYNHRVVTQGNVYFRMPKANATTLDEFKAWLQANPTTVYYELAEPIITQLEPQQLFSFEGTTHITSDNTLMPIISTKVASNVQAVVSTLMIENKELTKEVSTLNIENEELKSNNIIQDELIDVNMCATDEMYVMLEPLLKSIPQTLNVEMEVRNPMVDLYVAMVMRGLKTIEQVPERYREEVARILAQLEK